MEHHLRIYLSIFLILISINLSCSSNLKLYFMPTPCSYNTTNNINVQTIDSSTDTSGILTMSVMQAFASCNAVITPPNYWFRKDTGIIVTLEKLYLTSLANSRVTLSDGSTSITLTERDNTFAGGSYLYTSTVGAPLTINFYSQSMSKWSYSSQNFKMIFTAYTRGCGSYSNSFRCTNGRCISKRLTCDGYNHCGDHSDEWGCYNPGYNSVGTLVGYSFGGIFLFIALLCGLIIIIKRSRQNQRVTTTTVSTIHPPPRPNTGYPTQQPYPVQPASTGFPAQNTSSQYTYQQYK